MRSKPLRYRRATNILVNLISGAAATFGLVILAWIIVVVVMKGSDVLFFNMAEFDRNQALNVEDSPKGSELRKGLSAVLTPLFEDKKNELVTRAEKKIDKLKKEVERTTRKLEKVENSEVALKYIVLKEERSEARRQLRSMNEDDEGYEELAAKVEQLTIKYRRMEKKEAFAYVRAKKASNNAKYSLLITKSLLEDRKKPEAEEFVTFTIRIAARFADDGKGPGQNTEDMLNLVPGDGPPMHKGEIKDEIGVVSSWFVTDFADHLASRMDLSKEGLKTLDDITRAESKEYAQVVLNALKEHGMLSPAGIRLNTDFITKLPPPPAERFGGYSNAIKGTIFLTLFASLLAIPIGLFTGVFLSEFGRDSWAAGVVKFAITIILGTPSIIVGVFAYAFLVKPWLFESLLGIQNVNLKGIGGIFALFVIMLPVMARTTEDMLNLVPNALRESALALGMPRWKVTTSVLFRAAKSGLITGMMLAIARIGGETAPLLFTAGDSSFGFNVIPHSWSEFTSNLTSSMPNLTVKIYNMTTSPYEYWQQLGWAGSLIIMGGILLVNIASRVLFMERKKK